MASTRQTKQPDLWAAEFITFAAATTFLGFRLLSRRLTRIPLWWDDYLAMCCYAMAVAWVIIVPYWISKGLGLHIEDIANLSTDDALYTTKLLLYIAEIVYASALFFAKASILCFYWRMFRVTNIKLPIQILFGCSLIWIIIRTFMAIFHCVPVAAFWDSSIENAKCDIEDSKFFFGTILVHVCIDIAILVLPVMQIQKLRLPTLQKLGIVIMFTFGIFICVAAIIIIVASTQFDQTSTDITWNICTIVIWASVEVNLVTISACLPIVRPAFLYLFTCTDSSSTAGSGSNSYGQSFGRSQAKKSIWLSTLHKATEGDESSSTHQLAESEPRGRDSLSDFENHALDRFRGNKATVTGPTRDLEFGSYQSDEGIGGIMVRNETTVRVSIAKLPED